MGSLLQDVRFGLRQLAKSPEFALVAALTLAMGIGANAPIFSVINPILIEALPYPQPERPMTIWCAFEGARSQVAFHGFREIAARSRSFESLAILEPWQGTIRSKHQTIARGGAGAYTERVNSDPAGLMEKQPRAAGRSGS